MRIPIMEHDEAIKQFAKLTFEKKLIPIFGSGFTKGCKSYKGNVLDGNQATEIMRELLLKNSTDFTETDLNGLSFNDIAKNFYDYVPEDTRIEFFRNYFTEVEVEGYRKEFLQNIDWPYAYTLNVDDGIERTSVFTEVLPYKNLNRPRTSIRLLYKLHGDAMTEVTYKTNENIIFSSQQYLKSINDERNVDFLKNLSADFTQQNILFIGCSLESEIDIEYVYGRVEDKTDNTYRAIIKTTAPTLNEETQLRSYGINLVILVKDYELFYLDFIREYKEITLKEEIEEYRFKNPKVMVCSSKEETIKYLSGIRIFDEGKNAFYKSGMHIVRKCVNEIERKLTKTNCVVLKGRRFSGKSFILCSLCERQKRSTIYYFPSTTMVDELLVFSLLGEKKNSLFIFDSNSLSSNTYLLIANSGENLEKNNNKIILTANSNDNFIVNILHSDLVEVDNYFVEDELKQNLIYADKFGLTRKRRGFTNFDYLHVLAKEQKVEIPGINTFPQKLRFNEQMLLLLLCALDKVFLADILALGISIIEVKDFCNRFSKIVEEVPVERDEATTHSATKIVHNSKIILLEILRNFPNNSIIECIANIVRKFKTDKQRSRIYIEVILFDTLNQLFGGKRGAGHLIFEVYKALEGQLNDSSHYWLQRAKSIYRILPDNINELKNAYSYAKKCYLDGNIDLKSKAALTTSLICNLLSNLTTGEVKMQYEIESVDLAYEAVFSDYYRVNPRYLNNELTNRKNSYEMIIKVCNSVMGYCQNTELEKRAEKILYKINDYEKIPG